MSNQQLSPREKTMKKLAIKEWEWILKYWDYKNSGQCLLELLHGDRVPGLGEEWDKILKYERKICAWEIVKWCSSAKRGDAKWGKHWAEQIFKKIKAAKFLKCRCNNCGNKAKDFPGCLCDKCKWGQMEVIKNG